MDPLIAFINPVDIGIIAIFGFCSVRGFFRGFIKELFALIAVFGGFYAACTYYPLFAIPLSKWIDTGAYLNILSFLILFIGIFIIINLLGAFIKYLLNIVFLGWMDRIFGIGLGAIKGLLLISIILMALTTFLPNGKIYLKQSKLYPRVARVTEAMAQAVPKEMKSEFFERLKELKNVWMKSKLKTV